MVKALLQDQVDVDLNPSEDFYKLSCSVLTISPTVEPMVCLLELGFVYAKNLPNSWISMLTKFTTLQVDLEWFKDGQWDAEDSSTNGTIYKKFLRHFEDIVVFTNCYV